MAIIAFAFTLVIKLVDNLRWNMDLKLPRRCERLPFRIRFDCVCCERLLNTFSFDLSTMYSAHREQSQLHIRVSFFSIPLKDADKGFC